MQIIERVKFNVNLGNLTQEKQNYTTHTPSITKSVNKVLTLFHLTTPIPPYEFHCLSQIRNFTGILTHREGDKK